MRKIWKRRAAGLSFLHFHVNCTVLAQLYTLGYRFNARTGNRIRFLAHQSACRIHSTFFNQQLAMPFCMSINISFVFYSDMVGTSCLESTCERKPINFTRAPKGSVSTLQCDCQSSGTAKCPAGAGGPKPSQWQSFTGDKLQNLTRRNMTDYLLKTYGNFIRKRQAMCGVNFRKNVSY